ncbi:hypothetical protein FH588_20630 [Leptospira interrogans]|uniref:hypothetical protein n=1 Tax=Leptospira interrogans TaxID=173 RepID=UPI001F4C963F|nr:hypothetical protein [Leptospira interrogans]UNE66881.1 hypothetical protein FH588_20630 [Leptospira interrogans]
MAEDKQLKPYKTKPYEAALLIYLSGEADNAEQLSAVLLLKGIKVTANTIRSWMKVEDENGHDWEQRRAVLWEKILKQNQEEVTLKLDKIRDKCSDILDGIFEDLEDTSLRFKTKDAAIYSLSNMVTLLKGFQTTDKWKNPIFVISEYTKLLEAIPAVRRVLKSNHNKIQKQLNAVITQEREINEKAED